MTTIEFRRYLKLAVPAYARDHIRAGDVDPKKALAKAKAEYAELLPKGVATPGHHLYTIVLSENDKAIGMLWFDLKQRHGKRKAFIFDFRLEKAQRGKGLGRQALAAAARALYEKSGFRYSSMHMTKDLY
jgi:GNAT superfamily N-acetyltransferase